MDDPDLTMVSANFEKSVTKYYQQKIYTKVITEKKRVIKKWRKRADYQGIISLKEVKIVPKQVSEKSEEIQNDLESKIEIFQQSNSNVMECFDKMKMKYAELERKYEESVKEIQMLEE